MQPPKKIKAPKGLELKLEKPIKLKGDQIKRDLHTILTGNKDKKRSSVRGVINELKVKRASKLGKFK